MRPAGWGEVLGGTLRLQRICLPFGRRRLLIKSALTLGSVPPRDRRRYNRAKRVQMSAVDLFGRVSPRPCPPTCYLPLRTLPREIARAVVRWLVGGPGSSRWSSWRWVGCRQRWNGSTRPAVIMCLRPPSGRCIRRGWPRGRRRSVRCWPQFLVDRVTRRQGVVLVTGPVAAVARCQRVGLFRCRRAASDRRPRVC